MNTAPPPPSRSHSPPIFAVACFFVLILSQFALPDPDMFHEMALAREIVKHAAVPARDLFAYTPTLSPVVHHEWGTGLVLLVVSRALGAPGLIALRYILALSTFFLAVRLSRSRGATTPNVALVALLCALPLANGFGTVRAQDFTLLFTTLLLCLLDLNDRRSRGWPLIWLPLYVLWLNIHGGFVAGVALFAMYALETALRRTGNPLKLSGILALMLALTLVNPYGLAYPRYILHATTMPRPAITEWAPIWHAGAPTIATFAAICILSLYAFLRTGWQHARGCLLLAASLAIATLHLRHASLAALVACCYLPAWLTTTPLGAALARAPSRPTFFLSASLAAACLVFTLRNAPWRLPIPANASDQANHEPVIYPAGAVRYLTEHRIQANVMTPFLVGGYVSWKCYPDIKVSIDGRYEVAYEPSLLTEITDCYAGRPGWESTLSRYPTDLVLLSPSVPLAKLLADKTHWSPVYRDDVYELWARPGLSLPPEDHRGQSITPTLP